MGFQPYLKIQKKLIVQFQEKNQAEGQMEGLTERQKDGQTLFYRTLPATASSPKKSKYTFHPTYMKNIGQIQGTKLKQTSQNQGN